MSTQPMFPHLVGCVNTRDLYVRASLGQTIQGAEVLALLRDLDNARAELDAAEERAKEAQADHCKEAEAYEDDIASLNDTITKRNDLADKLVAAVQAGLTPEYVATVEAERDEAIESRDAIANASQTWTTSKLSSFILETAERQRIENERLIAEVQRLTRIERGANKLYSMLTEKKRTEYSAWALKL